MNINPRNVIIYFIIWRVLSVFIVQTSHVPDEYWQSLEVAHKLAFGYGYLTWEWRYNIRSYIYPFLISILYKILGVLQIDYPVILIVLPRLFQALLSAYADYRFYKWTNSKWASLFLTTNWYWYYCATRTLTNTVETALTTIALSSFPWNRGDRIDTKFLWIVGFVCAMRPTMAIPWLPLCAYHILNAASITRLIKHYSIISSITLMYSITIDYYCSRKLILSQWEFFKVNILNDVADFYGTHSNYWYLTSALPVLIGLHTFYLPIVMYKVLKSSKINSKEFILIFTIIWTILIYSLLKHKEFRFIMPILPAIIYTCACNGSPLKLSESLKKLLIIVFIFSNLIPMAYFSFIHQRGPLEAMKVLRNQLKFCDSRSVNLLFLTPCHATPLYSHIHENVTIEFLTCEPNLLGRVEYVDEADEFFREPMVWVEKRFNVSERNFEKLKLPDFVILYDNVVGRLTGFLENYGVSGEVFNSHFPENNYGEYIRVYRRK